MQSDDFMTGEELGNTLLGVSPGTLHGWEQGRHMPTGTGRTLLRVAENILKRWLTSLDEAEKPYT